MVTKPERYITSSKHDRKGKTTHYEVWKRVVYPFEGMREEYICEGMKTVGYVERQALKGTKFYSASLERGVLIPGRRMTIVKTARKAPRP